jgi:hypothetical protein
MIANEPQWVVCAPGDPTNAQWATMATLARNDYSTMIEVEELTGCTRAEIYRTDQATGETIWKPEVYTIAPDGAYEREDA